MAKYGWLLVLVIFFLSNNAYSTDAGTLQFYLYSNCPPRNSKENPEKGLEELRDKDPKSVKNEFFQVPTKFAKKNYLPTIGDKVYRFSGSKFVGTFKVEKMVYQAGEFGWYLQYLTSGTAKMFGRYDADATDVVFSGEVDTQKLKTINADNNDYLETYSLNDAQALNLKKKVVQFFQGSTDEELKDLQPRPQMVKVPGASDPQPDFYLQPFPADWQEVSTVGFSVYLRVRKQTLAIFNYDYKGNPNGVKWGPRIIVFKTPQKLYVYPGSNGTKFKQFIDWFGDYYAVIGEIGDGVDKNVVYKLTPDGLVKVAEGGVSTD